VADRRFSRLNLVILALIVALIVVTHATWMRWLGGFLVDAESPVSADLIVVLAGDGYGHRMLRAAELVKQGYATKVLVSGAPGFYDLHESDLAIPFATRRGYPAAWFTPLVLNVNSTQEEALAIRPELEKRHAHRVVVVTSDYHTRRALRMLRARWPGVEIHMVAAPDEFFSIYGWWRTREGRKIFFLEWIKTFAGFVGL
jgi:uncharacterized SAM-binding protein YcdF (DUF218 family)